MSGAVSAKSSTGAAEAEGVASPLAGRPARKQMLLDVPANGWFAARPSGTENLYQTYAQSFRDRSHLDALVSEAQQIVNEALV